MTAVTVGTFAAAAGCGEPADDPGTSAGTSGAASAGATPGGATATTASPSSKQNVTNITVTVAKGKVRTDGGGRVKVKRGTAVRVTITSDAADEFHLHGYDRTVELKPGTPGTLELTADKPGVFEAELHHSGARVFELQVG
ncbi:hypothetical protein [Actinomadura hibisca]|uniref:hypothetical protein n=1 Tax=Actinomadura hibisca TaxID=68565 RepID=UPI000AD794EA|nr:hypothetical protein [Actinomadura hibisca]